MIGSIKSKRHAGLLTHNGVTTGEVVIVRDIMLRRLW